MARFLLRRLLGALLVTLAVSFLTFALLEWTPGDAASVLAGDTASQAQIDELRREMGLDAPLLNRFATFVSGAVLRGDLGQSLVYDRPVASLVLERFRFTLALALAATGLALAGGLAAGLLAARRPNSPLDLGLMAAASLGLSLPNFWLALLLVMLFSLKLRWLPVYGSGTPLHLVLPALCLALPTGAVVARMARASMLDVARADYVRTAHAKGVPGRRVWNRHILRNSLIPVVTMLGMHLGFLLGGTFVVETIFAWPGLGRLMVQAIFDRDFPLILGGALVVALLFQFITLSVDLLHAWLDPRVGQEAL